MSHSISAHLNNVAMLTFTESRLFARLKKKMLAYYNTLGKLPNK